MNQPTAPLRGASPCNWCYPASPVPGTVPVLRRSDLEPRFVLALFVLLATAWAANELLGNSFASRMVGAATIVVLGAFASVVAHHLVFKPLRQLVAAARAVRAGDFSKRLRFERSDEIGALGRELDAVSAEVEAAQVASAQHIAALDRLRHADRVAAVGTLTSSVAHELGNPLNVIELRAQLIASSDAASLHDAQQNARLIVEQSRRMTAIINRSLALAPMKPAKLEQIDLLAALRMAIALSQPVAHEHEVTIRLEAPGSTIPIAADFDKVVHAVVILVLNGVLAMPEGGTLEVHVRDTLEPRCDAPDGPEREHVCIDVVDDGVGIPQDGLPKVFDPLYSSRSPDGGAGLGLAVARGIAQQHHGWISVESTTGRGSSFTVHLPKHAPEYGEAHGS